MKRAYYDAKPKALEAVGNGDYLYHWDIQEETVQAMQEGSEYPVTERTQFSCFETVIHGEPTYDKCVEAVIRNNYTSDAELAMLNKYNSYQTGIISDDSIVTEYEQYLQFVASTKDMVRKDLEIETPEPVSTNIPRLADMARLMAMTINTLEISDDDALSMKSLYPTWDSKIGTDVKTDEKLQYGGKLWKVLQPHKVQEQNKPGTGTESLYTEISESHAGTAEDPIPYNGNMELENGKYYSQSGKVYKCTRDTGIPVYQPLADLVGIYVELYDPQIR